MQVLYGQEGLNNHTFVLPASFDDRHEVSNY